MRLLQKFARVLCTFTCVFVFADVDTAKATGVSVGTNLVATFDENVKKGTGNITIVETGVGTFEVIPVTSGQVSVSGRVVTIDPVRTLKLATRYHVLIDATAIDDTSGNSFAGISESTTWDFTTQSSANLLVNPGFEAATGNLATDWSLAADGSISYVASQNGAGYSGSAQQITIHASGSWGLYF